MSAAAISSITDRIDQLTGRFEPPPMALGQRPSVDADFAAELARLTADQKAAYSANARPGAAMSGLFNLNPTAGGSTAASPAANTVIGAATEELGVPYLWGGTTSAGWDCSGLVQHAYREAGVSLPRVSRDQARMGVEVPSIDQALPGDLVAFGHPTVDHIGIYVGNGQMLHAPRRGDVVKIGPIQRKIATIRRVLTPGAPEATTLTTATRLSAASQGTASAAPAQFKALFERAGSAHGIDPGLLAAVAKNESAFNPNAVSPAGAQGIMQFMPGTAAQFGVDPFDPASAIDGAARFLRQLQDQFGSVELALAAYNAGPGNVTKYGGIPPFTETRNYVTKVMNTWRTGT